MKFYDLPWETRLEAFRGLNAIKAECAGYVSEGIQIAIPRDGFSDVLAWAEKQSLELIPDSLFYFALGSDKPSDHLRHDGPSYYPRGNKGFWFYGTFRLKKSKEVA